MSTRNGVKGITMENNKKMSDDKNSSIIADEINQHRTNNSREFNKNAVISNMMASGN